MKSSWSVVIVYEDVSTREEAVRFSDDLVGRFWADYEFDFGWWAVQDLDQADKGTNAAAKAIKADLLVFALQPDGSMPDAVLAWIEDWIRLRGDHEGALVGLLDPAAAPSGTTTERYLYLRSLAHRAGMDYLIQCPENMRRPIPDSLDSYAERAGQKTSVLDDIIRRPSGPILPRIKPQRILR